MLDFVYLTYVPAFDVGVDVLLWSNLDGWVSPDSREVSAFHWLEVLTHNPPVNDPYPVVGAAIPLAEEMIAARNAKLN